MDLIRIQCETCQSWLKVRGEGFIGEVHACPKCGSMVLIASPPPAASADAPTAQAPEAPAPVTLGLGDTLEATDAPEQPAEPATPEPIEPDYEPGPEPIAEAASGWAPIATTAISLMATGAILAVWWVSEPSESVATADPLEPAAIEPSPIEEPTQPLDQTPEIVDPTPDEIAPVEPESLPVSEEPSDPATEPDEPAFQLPPETETAETPPSSTETPTEPAFDEAPSVIDPLSLDPTEIELVLRKGDATPGAIATPTDIPEPAAIDGPPVVEEPTLDDRLAAAAKRAGIFVRRGPTDDTTGSPAGSAETALTRVVPSVELRDIPLDKAIRLLGELAGLPITLDPVALQRAGVAADKPIDLVAEEQTLAELLNATLKSARLAYTTDGPSIVVYRQGADRPRQITHQLNDLAGDDPEALAERLERLLAADRPLSINAAGELTLDAPMGLHYDLLVACERLRLERGLSAGTKYPRHLLPTDSISDAIGSLLERRTTFSFVEPTPLARVIDHWRRVTKRPILVDWQALGEAGLGPRTTIECSVTSRPLRMALDGVLQPLGLAWAPAIGDSLWITTADRARQTRLLGPSQLGLSPLPAEQALRD